MSILSSRSLQCFSIFQRSMIQTNELPLCEVRDSSLFAEAFQEDKVVFGTADENVFTPAITLWAMISQFFFKQEGRSCKAAAGRVVSLIAQTAGRVVAQNAGNYCRAKAKLPVATIKKIALRLASQVETGCRKFDDLTTVLDSDQAKERLSPRVIAEIRSLPIEGRIIMVDGFTVDGPDPAENQAEYPQNPVQEEGLGFPILRCVCLISMITGMLMDLGYAAYSGKGTGETAILRQLSSTLRAGDIVVADSYHCTYWFIAFCIKLGVHVVVKNHHKRDDNPIGAKKISETERTVKWPRPARPKWMSKKEYRRTPEFIEMRLSDVSVDTPGSRSEGFTIATTLLDVEEHPGAWLDPSKLEDLWFFDGMPQSSERRQQIFSSKPQRIFFAGHYHRWMLVSPERTESWDGVEPICLDGKYFVVLNALVHGAFATYDTTTKWLTPFQL